MRNCLIFGGTFDPVHNGHINTVINVQDHYHFDEIIFLPCKLPLLKHKAQATAKQRVDMLQIAINHFPKYPFIIDTREIRRDSPSYMVTTLEDYRQQPKYSDCAITLMIGRDTFLQLPQWHQWQKILSLTNLLVINRPGIYHPSLTLSDLLKTHQTHQKDKLTTTTQGLIYCIDAGYYEISSTAIRQYIQHNTPCTHLLSQDVFDYIQQNKLYV